MGACMDGCMDRCMDGCMDGCMDEGMHEKMHGFKPFDLLGISKFLVEWCYSNWRLSGGGRKDTQSSRPNPMRPSKGGSRMFWKNKKE